MNRWKENFENLLNCDDPADNARTIAEIRATAGRPDTNSDSNSNEEAMEVSMAEVSKAINQLRRNKAPGVCNITTELLRDTGRSTQMWMHRVISAVLEQEVIPQDWKKVIIIPIHKKGDRKECGNSRGISLLSVPGKVLTRIILNRIGKIIDEEIRDNQCGLRLGRGCSDQIFLLRQLIEKNREFGKDIYISFIDFSQAYDSVWRDGMWELLEKYGVAPKMIRILRNLYEGITACVRIEGENTEAFEVRTGLRQGCILSPTLFNITLDYIMRRAMEGKEGIKVDGRSLKDAEYADDAALLAETLISVVALTNYLASESEKFGLKLNIPKTKIMAVTRKFGPLPEAIVGNNTIEVVDNFVYLGSQLCKEGGSEGDVKRRLALAGATFHRLWEKVFKRHEISLAIKLRLLNAAVMPILLYGSETWSLTTTLENRVNACENRWLRRILRIKYTDRVSNMEVRARTGQEIVENTVRKRRMKWYGHITRMNKERWTSRVHNWNPAGKRPCGRPKLRWLDGVEKDLKRAGLSLHGITTGRKRVGLKELVEDRARWKDITAASMAGRAYRMIT